MVMHAYPCMGDKPLMLLGVAPDLNVQLHAGNKHSVKSQTMFKCLTVSCCGSVPGNVAMHWSGIELMWLPAA